jgi:catechol 2,3-dioxygenase-like lactoylglutathione lyase family enzyme
LPRADCRRDAQGVTRAAAWEADGLTGIEGGAASPARIVRISRDTAVERARLGHVALAVDNLDETLAWLSEQGIEPERPPYRVREGGSRLCFVRDPDG